MGRRSRTFRPAVWHGKDEFEQIVATRKRPLQYT